MLQKFITLSLIVLVVAGMPLDAKKKESQEAVLLNCGPSGHPLDPQIGRAHV